VIGAFFVFAWIWAPFEGIGSIDFKVDSYNQNLIDLPAN